MNVKVNGKLKKVKSNTISELLKELDINPIGAFISVNEKIIKWYDFATVAIKKNDNIKISKFIAGG